MTIIEIYRTGIIARGGGQKLRAVIWRRPSFSRTATPPPELHRSLSARVVLALRATTKRDASDAPGELASISVATALFVSFRASRRRAFVSGARGGDKSRDALRRTGRDAVSGPRATPRIKVAQQPASTQPAFVVARSALPYSPPATPRWRRLRHPPELSDKRFRDGDSQAASSRFGII